MEAGKLRLKLRMNGRLKLESQALLSRLFREHDIAVSDELLSRLVFAVPNELMAESDTANPSKVMIPPSHPRKPDDDDDKTPPSHPPKREDDDDADKPPSRPPKVTKGGLDTAKPPSRPPTKQ